MSNKIDNRELFYKQTLEEIKKKKFLIKKFYA